MGTYYGEDRSTLGDSVALAVGRLARREVLRDDADTRVSLFTIAPGEQTGWHRHDHDYLVVNLTDAEFTFDIRQPDGTIVPGATSNRPRDTHTHPVGVEHNATNAGSNTIVLVEIEHKRTAP